MIEWLDNLDSRLLMALNSAHSPLLDKIMWLISSRAFWIPLYVILTAMIWHRFGKKQCVLILAIIGILIFATDQTCSHILKPLIERLRPTHPDNPISASILVVNDYRGSPFGFPSCHAANTFALTVFLSLCFKDRFITLGLIFWSCLVSYSRIYLGVHYPGDILGGCFIGGVYALLSYQFYLRIRHLYPFYRFH